jgi:hypothetical protein
MLTTVFILASGVFIGLLLAPFVSFDDWLYDKYTKRQSESVKATVNEFLIEKGIIQDDV